MPLARTLALAVLLSAAPAGAQEDPAIGKLERALPAGWSLLATDTELVVRHDRPCFVTNEHRDNEPPVHVPAHTPDGRLVTLELRYKLEPRWTKQQFADAKVVNDRIAVERVAARAKYKIDAIHISKGRPLAATPDEQSRLAAYDKEIAKLATREVKLPNCTLGESSLFDGEDTYAQLRLEVDPPEAMKEAYAVIETVKRQCGEK